MKKIEIVLIDNFIVTWYGNSINTMAADDLVAKTRGIKGHGIYASRLCSKQHRIITNMVTGIISEETIPWA